MQPNSALNKESDDFNEYEPLFILNNPTYSELEKRLNQLIAESYKDYRQRTKEYAKYVINYNSDLPPHVLIRKKIEEYL